MNVADTPPPAYQAQDDNQPSMGMSQNNNAMPPPHHPPGDSGPQPMDTSSIPPIPIPKHVASRGIGKKSEHFSFIPSFLLQQSEPENVQLCLYICRWPTRVDQQVVDL